MTDAIKLKVLPKFPSKLIGGAGIGVTKANGNYTLDLDYNDFPVVGSLPASITNALIHDPATGQYSQLPITLLGVSGTPAYKVMTFSRALTLAAGIQVITGVGFKPNLVLFQTGVGGGGSWSSVGQSDGSIQTCLEFSGTGAFFQNTFAGIQRADASNYQAFNTSSFDADGFTLTWSKVGSPTITAQVSAICYR